jgi:peptidyl-prolyl cis-trans isomerase C
MAWAAGAPAQLFKPAAKPAAVVNGTAISMEEVESLLKQGGPTPMALTEAQKKQMQFEVLNVLIDDLLTQQFLRKHGPKVEQAEIDKKLLEMKQSLAKINKKIEDFLKETGQTPDQLRNNILNKLQWDGYVSAHLTEKDVENYYQESKDFFDRVLVKASHIVLRVSPDAPAGERQSAKLQLAKLREDIVSGKITFSDAAKKYSVCTSAPNGGDIGYFPRKTAVEEAFARTAFALKVGEISDVVQTDYGMHLITVTDRKVNGPPSEYSKVKDDVRMLCIEEMRLGLLSQQRKNAKVEINLPQ